MTQADAVFDYIAENGYITAILAIRELGITDLAGRIRDLKKRGYDIQSEYIEAPTRYGNKKTKVKRYWL